MPTAPTPHLPHTGPAPAPNMSRNRDVSRYVIVVDNISSSTPTKDVEHEMAAAGRIRDIVRDHKLRLALVEYER